MPHVLCAVLSMCAGSCKYIGASRVATRPPTWPATQASHHCCHQHQQGSGKAPHHAGLLRRTWKRLLTPLTQQVLSGASLLHGMWVRVTHWHLPLLPLILLRRCCCSCMLLLTCATFAPAGLWLLLLLLLVAGATRFVLLLLHLGTASPVAGRALLPLLLLLAAQPRPLLAAARSS